MQTDERNSPALRVTLDGGSFRDPSGRVYHLDWMGTHRVVRGLSTTAASLAERLLSESFIQRLIAEGDIVKTTLLPPVDPVAARIVEKGWAAVVEHEPLEFLTPNPSNRVVGVAEREIRDMEERLSGRFWTVGAGERLATVMWSSPARDRTSRRRSLAGLGRVWVTLG